MAIDKHHTRVECDLNMDAFEGGHVVLVLEVVGARAGGFFRGAVRQVVPLVLGAGHPSPIVTENAAMPMCDCNFDRTSRHIGLSQHKLKTLLYSFLAKNLIEL